MNREASNYAYSIATHRKTVLMTLPIYVDAYSGYRATN